MLDKVSLAEKFGRFSDHWSPKVVGELNGQLVKLVKFQGAFVWHHHDTEDEMFLVLKGTLRIDMEAGPVTIREGEFYVVPKGVRHNPVAEQEVHVLLFERKSTLHSGNEVTSKTRSIEEQLRPV